MKRGFFCGVEDFEIRFLAPYLDPGQVEVVLHLDSDDVNYGSKEEF